MLCKGIEALGDSIVMGRGIDVPMGQGVGWKEYICVFRSRFNLRRVMKGDAYQGNKGYDQVGSTSRGR